MTQSRISTVSLDFLRGVAAVYVVINHTRGAFFKGGEHVLADAAGASLGLFDYVALLLLQMTSLGTEFVILFFCISGISMAHSINGNHSILAFYTKRIIRIWPPYVAAVVLAAFACWLFISLSPTNPFSASCSNTFCSFFNVSSMLVYINTTTVLTPQFWSLPYEVLFYVLCPFLLSSRFRIVSLLFIAFSFSVVGNVIYGIGLNPSSSILINFIICALFWFMCGAAVYHFIEKVPVLSPPSFYLISLLTLVIVYALKKIGGGSNSLSGFVMIIFAINCVKNIPYSIASIKFINLGYFSYSIYIFHYVFVAGISFFLYNCFGVEKRHIESYFLWTLAVPPIILMCLVLYHCVEKRCNLILSHMRQLEKGGAT